MLSNLKGIIGTLFSYGISHFLVISIPLILVPVLTREFSMNEFADYSLYKVLIGFTNPIIGFAFTTYLLRHFYIDLKDNLNKFLVTAFIYSFLIAFILLLISLVFKDSIIAFLDLKNSCIPFFVCLNTYLYSIHSERKALQIHL